MNLSPLQKYILNEVYSSRQKIISRSTIKRFYNSQTSRPKPDDMQNIITKSLERLIDRGLMIGWGRRTTRKWYIEGLKLTPSGRRIARRLLGKQEPLPLFKRHKK